MWCYVVLCGAVVVVVAVLRGGAWFLGLGVWGFI